MFFFITSMLVLPFTENLLNTLKNWNSRKRKSSKKILKNFGTSSSTCRIEPGACRRRPPPDPLDRGGSDKCPHPGWPIPATSP